MSRAEDRGTLDWLVELAGALVPAAAAGFAAMRLGPAYGIAPEAALAAGFATIFVIAFAVMRAVPAEPRLLAIAQFEQRELADDVSLLVEALGHGEPLLDRAPPQFEELLLDQPWVEPEELLLDQPLVEAAELAAVAELLLDDPLPVPPADSRVVQLFAPGRMPTAGQLQRRIDRHIAGGDRSIAGPPNESDASDALGAALAELRRSLRQA